MSWVEIENHGPIRHVILAKPEKRNALDDEFVLQLGAAFEGAALDASVHAVVVRGRGPDFSSGMDLETLHGLSEQPGRLREFHARVLPAWNRLEEMLKPTIAQIHGACLGGAVELALACDFRVISDDAVIGVPEVRLGMILDCGGSSRLPAIVGLGNAKDLVMTGRLIDGREAHRMGLASRLVPADQLEEETDALLTDLLSAAPLAVGYSKRVLDAAAKPALSATLEQEVTAQQVCTGSVDFSEGTRASLEQREPSFLGC